MQHLSLFLPISTTSSLQWTSVFCVQQGDGTAFIFKDEPCVFTFSVHCGKNFPVRKQQSDLDVSVEDELEDKEYLSTGT